MNERKPSDELISTAYFVSRKVQYHVWYICQRAQSSDVIVSDVDVNRHLGLGYKVHSAFYLGKKYRNIYIIGGELRYVA